jgi:hypothetical protein
MNVTAGCSTFDLNQFVRAQFWCFGVLYKCCTLMFSKKKKYRIPTLGALYKNELVASIWRSPTKYNMIPTKIIWSLYVGFLLYSLYYLLKELNRDPHWLIVLLKKKIKPQEVASRGSTFLLAPFLKKKLKKFEKDKKDTS